MMQERLRSLYNYAYDQNIYFLSLSFSSSKKAVCARHEDIDAIIMDTRRISSETEEKLLLAEELGHLQTGALLAIENYNRPNYMTSISKAENKAKRWAIQKLIPKDELDRVVNNGVIEVWALAEYFEVPEDFMAKAIEFYKISS